MKAAAGAGARKDAVADISKFVSRSAAADTDSSWSVAKVHCRIEVTSSQVKSRFAQTKPNGIVVNRQVPPCAPARGRSPLSLHNQIACIIPVTQLSSPFGVQERRQPL